MMNKLKITNMRNVYLSLGVIFLSLAGMMHTFIGGGWSKSTGEAAKMYPRMVYGILFAVALCLLIMELIGRVPHEPPAIAVVKWWHIPAVLAATAAFFLFVVNVGVIVGILGFLFGMIWMFDEDPKKHWKMNLLVAAIATGALWLIFMQVLPIMTLHQILI